MPPPGTEVGRAAGEEAAAPEAAPPPASDPPHATTPTRGGATSPRSSPPTPQPCPRAPLSGSPPKLPGAAASPQGSPAAPYLPARRPAAPPAAGRRVPPPPRRQPLPAPLPPNFWAAPARLHGGSCAAGGRRGGPGWAGQGQANAVPTAGLSRRRARPGPARPLGRAACLWLRLRGRCGGPRRGCSPQAAPGPVAAPRAGKGEKQSRTAREFAGQFGHHPIVSPSPVIYIKTSVLLNVSALMRLPCHEGLKPVKSNSHRHGRAMHAK